MKNSPSKRIDTPFSQIRKILGLSQLQAAVRLSMTQSNVSKIENGASVSLDQLKSLVKDSDYEIVVVVRNKKDPLDQTIL